jgi:hypothetical protein
MFRRILFALAVFQSALRVVAQPYTIDWFAMSNGGTTSAGSGYTLEASAGQWSASVTMSGGGYVLESGAFGSDLAESPPAIELRIIAISISGNTLSFSFPTSAGQSFVVESTADLGSTQWQPFQGSTFSSAGGMTAVTLPISSDESQRFYRLRRLP